MSERSVLILQKRGDLYTEFTARVEVVTDNIIQAAHAKDFAHVLVHADRIRTLQRDLRQALDGTLREDGSE